MGKYGFVFGPSCSGKSTEIYKELLTRSETERDRNYFIIVPDQFTMSTQRRMCDLSGSDGILNVDVLSFGRLTHRILEEVGYERYPVLDDTGKSLILQKIAHGCADELPVLGSKTKSVGYIHEIKSVISEFMQYGHTPDDVERIIGTAGLSGALRAKLKDLNTVYGYFKDYLEGKYITTEGRLDLLTERLVRSSLIPGSVIFFDGFTGFTPIQLRVISELIRISDEVIFAFTFEGDHYAEAPEQDLFSLTRRSVKSIMRISEEIGAEKEEDRYITGSYRKEVLSHLERNVLRFSFEQYKASDESKRVELRRQLRIAECMNPDAECREAAVRISDLTKQEGYKYSDIAIVAGDLEEYAPFLEREFAKQDIPAYFDRTRAIRLNPLTEGIGSLLDMVRMGYEPESVIRFIRSGLSGLSFDEGDKFEEYIRLSGVRGRSRWEKGFERKTRNMPENEKNERLYEINLMRERIVSLVGLFAGAKTVKDYVSDLKRALEETHAQETIAAYAEEFGKIGDAASEKEYDQIYDLAVSMLDQMEELLGDEETDISEFAEIVKAGFAEIRVGTIPQSIDRVLVGDIERTRLGEVKVLFFLGVNDGNIPKDGSSGGLISEIDREVLEEAGVELAPTPKRLMYDQRLYLYMNLTKPSEKLFISYSLTDNAGGSRRKSYLIPALFKIFPDLQTVHPEKSDLPERVAGEKDALSQLAESLREYVSGNESVRAESCTLNEALSGRAEDRKVITDAAFKKYIDLPLSPEAVDAVYGDKLTLSVSSMEKYSGCAYAFFLRYGLGLSGQEYYEIASVDGGNVMHGVLKEIVDDISNAGNDLRDASDEYITQNVQRILRNNADDYLDGIYTDTERGRYHLGKLENTLIRSVKTLRDHLRAGEFGIYRTEYKFVQELSAGDGRKVMLQGTVDRADICESDDKVYLRIIDYKSSAHKIDEERIEEGRNLQLPVYMKYMLGEVGREKKKDAVPAAMVYFRLDDPIEDYTEGQSDEELEKKIYREMRVRGMLNEDEESISRLDSGFKGMPSGAESDIMYFKILKDGGISSSGNDSVSADKMTEIMDKSMEAVEKGSKEIFKGVKTCSPYKDACKYCEFAGACGFDRKIPGYDMKR
ncbi:MAG: exodeoxyribonuclease V subunit gamma [Lachnospiraceae bacterium]|nr:exodeoxyribonuclease V subunit gamma [Lachnospiraceae bacterium]